MTQAPLRLLMFNLMTDVNDPVLGFTTAWIQELAKHCASIDVITMYQGELDLPEHVRVFSAGREKGLSKPVRVLNFYRHLVRLISTNHYDVCFAHMMPLFAGLGGPLLKLRGINTVLWYTHRQKSSQLQLGMQMSWRVVTAVSSSFPYETNKLRVIGHGIDTNFFAPNTQHAQAITPPNVIQVARLASIKHQDTTIQAIAGTDAQLTIVGDVQPNYPTPYRHELEALVSKHHLEDRVTFTGDLNAQAVRDAYHQATVAVNMSPVGLFDKAALESMACGIPTLVANQEFAPLMGDYAELLTVENPQDVEGLRARINQLLALSDAERKAIGTVLRDNVAKRYSLSHLAEELVSVLRTGEPLA